MKNNKVKFKDILSLCVASLRSNKIYHLMNLFIWLFLSILPLILGVIIKSIFDSLSFHLERKYFINLLLLSIVLFLNIFLTYQGGIFDVKSRFYIGKFLRVNLFKYFSSTYTKLSNSTVINMFNTDVDIIEEFISFTIDFFSKFVYFICTFLILSFINLKTTIFVFIPLLICSFVIYIFGEKIERNYLEAKREDIKTINLISSIIKYHSSIRYYNPENSILHNLKVKLDNRKKQNIRKQILFEFILKFTELFNNISYVIIMISSLYFMDFKMGLGDFTLFIEYVSYSSAYLLIFQDIFTKYKSIQKFLDNFKNQNYEKSNGLLSILNGKNIYNFVNLNPKLELKNFSLEDGMEPINLTLNQGEWLVVTGEVGSGKTRFINCILNNSTYLGEIFISGEKIRCSDSICADYVPQTSYLFDDTVINNITYYGEFDDDRFNKCLELACVNDDVFKSLIKDDIKLGKNGKILSEGQRQRVTIARALYANNGILIMDNCLANIDSKTREIILNNLATQKLTLIIVDEDLDFIKHKLNFKYLRIQKFS